MALTVTPYQDPVTGSTKLRGVIGDRDLWLGTITFDNSYPTGGEAVAASDFGFEGGVLDAVQVGMPVGGGRLVTYDRTNKKLLLFTAVGAEAANASDQSTITVPVLAIGR